MKTIKRVAVFCASSPGIEKVYFDAAGALAEILATNNISVNYGGGGVGLMGKLADVILENKGSITGFIPEFMVRMEWAHPGVKDMVRVENMHERKLSILANVDAVIALPGGVGTLDELMEVITLKQLGQFLKPVIIINTNGFYEPLFALLEKLVLENFMREEHQKIWSGINNPDELLTAIYESKPWDAGSINFAAVEKK